MRPPRATRALSLGVTAAAAFALAACGDSGGVGGATTASQAPTTSNEPVTLKYWTWFPAETSLKKVIDAYQKDHPNVTIELKEFEAADYQKQLPLALNGGESLDIVGVQVSAMTNTVNTQLRPVTEWESSLPEGWRDQLEAKPLEQAQKISKDGVLYDIPLGSIGSAAMYYNPAILDKAGVTVPGTLQELVDAAKKIKASDPSIQPVVFAGDGWWQEEMLFTIAGQTNPTLSDDILYGDTGWNDPAMVDALAAYKELFTSGAVDKATLSLMSPRPTEEFTKGKAAFYLDGSWQNSLLSKSYREANKINLADVGATGLPVIRPNGKQSMRAFAEGGLAIPKSSKNVAAAADFIGYLAFGDGVQHWAPDLVLSPSKKGYVPGDDVLASAAAKDGFTVVATLINNAGSNRDSNQDFLGNVEGNAILDVLNGKNSPQEAADEMQKQWTSGRYPH
ncbi:MAG: ABC transporter substrate-binding protein [Nostocoides sp.]